MIQINAGCGRDPESSKETSQKEIPVYQFRCGMAKKFI